MNEDQKTLYSLIENFFYHCSEYGYSDFETWCQDNIENDEQESLLYELKEHVNAVAGLLWL